MTLGVELVAKPTLLFLDEPTSGLDGQSAFNIVRFLRKLVDGGQAVLVSSQRVTIYFRRTNFVSVQFINHLRCYLTHLTVFSC